MRHDLLSLKIFMTIAEQGNMTKAAEQYHIAASAVSKRIGELEEKVGSPLFVRYPRGMELTPAGQTLRYYAMQLFETIDRMDQELNEYSSGIKGHIRIHAITSALAQHLPLDIAEFLNTCPKIKFDIEDHVGTAVARAVADGKADIGIIAEQTHGLGLESQPYRTDKLVVAVSERHSLAACSVVKFAEALEYEFIVSHVESSVHSLLSEQSSRLGIAIMQRIRVSSLECMCRLASTNLGVCILPYEVLRPYLRPFRLRAISLDESWANRSLHIISRKFESLSPTARAFVGHLTASPLKAFA